MQHFQILRESFGQVWRFRRMLWLLYGLVLATAFFIAQPVNSWVENAVGQSMALESLRYGWDYTFWTDLLREYGIGLQPIMQLSLLTILFFVVLVVFLLGGILTMYQKSETWESGLFWKSCAVYFWRLLRLTIYFWIIHAVVLGLFGWLFLLISGGLFPTTQENDAVVAKVLVVIAPIYVLVAAFCWMWQDYAKVEVVRHDPRWVFGAIWGSLRFVVGKFAVTYPIYLVLLLLLALVGWINWSIYPLIEETSTGWIWLSFLLSQLVLLTRLFLRLVQWQSASLVVGKGR